MIALFLILVAVGLCIYAANTIEKDYRNDFDE